MTEPPQPRLPGAPGAEPGAALLEGTLERVVFANPESAWSVVRLAVAGERELVTAVGNLLAVQPGESLRLTGSWEQDARYGRQFRVTSYQTVTPATLTGIERYLGSGLVRGIGKGLAKRLVERFGMETLAVIESSPERLAEVPGIGGKRSGEIRRAFREQRGIQELMVFLQSHGVATGMAVKIHKRYGEEAMAVVRESPYRLAVEVFGIGFRSADRIAAALGLPKDSAQRVEAALLHLLGEGAERGHCFLPRAALLEAAVALLGVEPARVEAGLATLAAAGEVVVEALPDGTAAVYLPSLHTAEREIAERLAALGAAPPPPLALDVERALDWVERREKIALAPEQREAIRLGLTRKALVVTGGPGTGKTTLVRGIVEVLARKGLRVLLAAPTGRAAKRLAEATGHEAATIHRLLEWNARSRGFERHRDRPLEGDLVVVDEASMLDAPLAAHLLRALPDRARLVLVGDVDQLPSVGPGRVLADLIHSGTVAVARLATIFRQAERSLIVTNAHRVQRGDMPLLEPLAGGEGEPDFFFVERETPEEVLETLRELLARRIPQRFGFDPVEEVQVLTPMNRGLLGTASLNGVLRELLNPAAADAPLDSGGGPRGFRVGDKVMQVRNDYDLEVFNGDLGRVVAVEEAEPRLIVSFDGRRVGYDAAALDELALAYACSIHKSQGSEYPCVVVPLHTQHYVMLQRNLLYTALTRARRLAVLVGEKRALRVAVGNARTRARYTRLAERLAAAGYPGVVP
ncbi:MAG TPA: ATP-dependent RecD-like DNA helicase [Thermoanaerobaculia bacterium]|nr:ATP-dependent RecD-like DNA helicase [Thermoanaerobaculia bacterium]